ncbi:MAG: hypothetical protein M1440_02440 [Gammaproteobacteria bacterium]|nr:hypothetical protein [Gammaproteobacteria bacterium]
MIKKLISVMVLSTLFSFAATGATIPENVALQRESMHALSLLLHMQAEGLQRRERNELQQSLQIIENANQRQERASQATPNNLGQFTSGLKNMVQGLEEGKTPTTEELSNLYLILLQALDQLHTPEQDKLYNSILVNNYLSLRYLYKSYVGLAESYEGLASNYYTMHLSDLVSILDDEINELYPDNEHNNIIPRWNMLKRSYSEMQQGWTRTVSGHPYTPTIVRLNATVLSRQLDSKISGTLHR